MEKEIKQGTLQHDYDGWYVIEDTTMEVFDLAIGTPLDNNQVVSFTINEDDEVDWLEEINEMEIA